MKLNKKHLGDYFSDPGAVKMVKVCSLKFNKKFGEVYKKYDGKFGDMVGQYVLLFYENEKNKRKIKKLEGMIQK